MTATVTRPPGLADDGVSVPEAPIVRSTADTGTLELQLFLQAT